MQQKTLNVIVMGVVAIAAAYAARLGYTHCAGWLVFALVVIAFRSTD